MMKRLNRIPILLALIAMLGACQQLDEGRQVIDFTDNWQFVLSDNRPDSLVEWKNIDVPHDWSIEGVFSPDHPAGVGGGALPGGIGWYKKTFVKPNDFEKVFVQFDGVYQNSTVWINGDSVGNRPNGYISFEYDITSFLKEGQNEVLVKVANSPQPNSRWYSGSGIYRDVRLVLTDKVYVPVWGVYAKPTLNGELGKVAAEVTISNDTQNPVEVSVNQEVITKEGEVVATADQKVSLAQYSTQIFTTNLEVSQPKLWDTQYPNLYQLKTTIIQQGKVVDTYTTSFGFRDIRFDVDKGFFLNGEQLKIKGVCLHHDLGALGAAFNVRAMERQLQIMQEMGVNAIRTSHNPPAPQVLDLCDQMGILVMDEMFDMWAKQKTEFDYSNYWDDWYEQDLRDFVKRDRNHPSVIVWSVGNEIIEQYNHEDSTGGRIAQTLNTIVKSLDDRPTVTANNDISPDNPLIKFGGQDLVGYNYHHENYEAVPKDHPGRPFIITESNSALATRGHYDMPSDSVRHWPIAWDQKFLDGNPDNTVSAYDNVCAPWGSTQEDTWRIVKRNDFISGMFIWTGFDYIGEPTPYEWPSRSSYFGVVDLAGLPKDTYYMYQSEWTDKTMLHVFPHWNWKSGQTIDIWAYYNDADEAELFINGVSQGVKTKGAEDFHVMWRVVYEPGALKVITRKEGTEVLAKTIETAGDAAKIALKADKSTISADGKDLSFITIQIEDIEGNLVPMADNLISFEISGPGKLVGVDNGDPTSHLSLKGAEMKAMAGKCIAIVQSTNLPGSIHLTAKSSGLPDQTIEINSK